MQHNYSNLNYKLAPTGTMATIPDPDSICAGCTYHPVIGECHKPYGPSCIGDVRLDSTHVVFVRPASEHYARIALERVYESIEVSAALHKEFISDLVFLKYRLIQEQFGKEHMRMLNWIDVKYKLFGSQWHGLYATHS